MRSIRTKPNWIGATYGWIILYTTFPIVSVVIAGIIASLADAKLDEGGPHPCIIFGVDFGKLLYAMGMVGWLMVITIPTGSFALACFTLVIAIWVLVRKLINRKQIQQP